MRAILRIELLSLFGKAFFSGSKALLIVRFGHLISVVVGTVSLMNKMTGNPSYEFYASGVVVFANVVLNIFFIPNRTSFGLPSRRCPLLTSVIYSAILLHYRRFGLYPFVGDYLKGLLLVRLATVGNVLVNKLPGNSPIIVSSFSLMVPFTILR